MIKYLFLFLLVIPVSAHTGVIVFPENQTVFINQTFAFQIIVSPDQNTSGMQTNVNYNDTVINISKISDGGLFGNSVYFYPGLSNKSRTQNIFSVILGHNSITKQGILANVTGKVTNESTSYINLTNTIISTPEGQAIQNTISNSSISVIYHYEDVTKDDKINIFDLMTVSRKMGVCTCIEDVNRDGTVNIFDLMMVSRAMT